MKTKMILKILVGLLVIVLFGLGAFMIISELLGRNHASLTSYSYSSGGDMQGSYDSVKIKKVDDDKALVIYASSPWHYMDNEVAEYIVSADTLTSIQKIFDSKKMYHYEKLPDSPFVVLDGATSSYYFYFADDKSVHFNSNQAIPQSGYTALKSIEEIIDQAAKAGEKLPGLVVEENQEENPFRRQVVEGERSLSVYEYRNNRLQYRIKNGLEEEDSLEGRIAVYSVENGSRTEVYGEDIKYPDTLYSMSVFEDEINLGEERLKAGRYILAAGNYETEFEIR